MTTAYPTTESTSSSSSSLATSDVRLNKSQYDPSSEYASVCVATVVTGNGFIFMPLQWRQLDDAGVHVVEQYDVRLFQKLQKSQQKTE